MTASIPLLGILPIFLSAAISFAVNALWYSPLLFGDAWAALAFPNKAPSPHRHAITVTLISLLVHPPILCFFLAVVGVANANDGILWALILALFHGGTHVSHAMFENKPIGLFILEWGSITVSLILSGGLLGALFGSP